MPLEADYNGQWVISDLASLLPLHNFRPLPLVLTTGDRSSGDLFVSGTTKLEAFFYDSDTGMTSLQLKGLDNAVASTLTIWGRSLVTHAQLVRPLRRPIWEYRDEGQRLGWHNSGFLSQLQFLVRE